LSKTQLRISEPEVTVTLPIDVETFVWFQTQGENAIQQMAIALKIYAKAHKA